MTNIQQKLTQFLERHRRWLPMEFFVAGFLFDIVTLGRIDSAPTLIQMASYLAITAWLIFADILYRCQVYHPTGKILKIWPWIVPATHFLLGSLLSAYTLFYFKSTSVFTSVFYVLALCGIMIANEFARFGKFAVIVRVCLWVLSLFSFFICVTPMLTANIGIYSFLLSLVFSFIVALPLYLLLAKRIPLEKRLLERQVRLPYWCLKSALVALYVMQVIPPVPLSLQYIGIYRKIERSEKGFELTYSRPWWKFWQAGEQDFHAREGDKVYCFAQIFSPSGFKDSLLIEWAYKDRRGWNPADRIPFEISGGREEGFRGYTAKQNHHPGQWRVKILTSDGRELGRIYFRIYEATEGFEFNSENKDVR